MSKYFRGVVSVAAFFTAQVVCAANPLDKTTPPVAEDQILKIKLALIESCENTPGCMALNGEKLLSGVPVTYPVSTTWEEYQKTFHSMQEVKDAIEAERKQGDQDGKP